MAIGGRALRRGSQHGTDVTAGLSRLYNAGFHDSSGSPRGRGSSRGRRPWAAVGGAVVVLGLGFGILASRVDWTKLEITGLREDQGLQRKDLAKLGLRVTPTGPAAGDVRVALNGTAIGLVPAKKGTALFADRDELVAALAPGKNTLSVTLEGTFVLGGESIERTFTYDPSGPVMAVPRQVFDPGDGEPITVRGLVDDVTTLKANGEAIPIEPGGAFSVDLAAGSTELVLTAKDAAGNPGRTRVAVTTRPAPPAYPETAAVHVAASDWADPAIRREVLGLAESGRINAVQLDIKDESGEVGYKSKVPLAEKVGATRDHYDPDEALSTLHDHGVRVIGRVVCFLDPTMAGWAADNGRSEMLVMDGAGTAPLANSYGSAAFTNLASSEVRDYQMDLADEAVRLGFDEILYDYVRRPEGDMATMTFEGLESSPDVAVARFVATTNERLTGTDAALGVSVFGIASTRGDQIAQDIRLMAPHVDYVAPMVYPSHWGAGEFDVADPNRQPGAIVGASVADFSRVVAGSGAAVVPWLQDFSDGVPYGVAQIREQIDAARYVGAKGFLLWNPQSTYTDGALVPVDG